MRTLEQLGISPAPWIVRDWIGERGKVCGKWLVDGDGNDFINECGGEGVDEITANARLIAAAPMLYEALRGLLEWRHGVYIDDPARTSEEKVKAMSEFCGLIAKARAALAAASGESEVVSE